MFTGLVEEVGTLAEIGTRNRGKVLRVSARKVLEDLALGDSVSINGACQTVTALSPHDFSVEAVGDTLDKTTLGSLPPGTPLNLERACRADSRMGGHFVLGHVNGVGQVSSWAAEGEAWSLEIIPPPGLLKYLVAEGSVTVDGISLTVAQSGADRFRVNVIPHTRSHTNLEALRPGRGVNLEVDILAKYIEGLLARPAGGLDEGRLHQWGYQ
jgi:riboflavin synthase